MKRSPLPRRTTPLPRSTKPLKRTAITRKPTKRRLLIQSVLDEVKTFYFKNFCYDGGPYGPCQDCRRLIRKDNCHAHHKIKRSLWVTASAEEKAKVGGELHGKRNLVIICSKCHAWFHAKPERLQACREHTGNANNGVKLNDMFDLY